LEKNILLNPSFLICDYEIASISAFKYHFTSLEIRGCFFHFCQSIYRKVNTIGFSETYKTNDNFKLWVRGLMSLALVPLDRFDEAFRNIISKKTKIKDIFVLIDYFKTTWISGNFSPSMWNHFFNIGPRTNNKRP
jgi:hypothetical protein